MVSKNLLYEVFIGMVSLGIHHNGIDIEVSYQLLSMWWGQGYATETVQAIINYALRTLGLTRLIAETQLANKPSRRLLECLGMHLEQTIHRFGAEQAIYVITSSS